MQSDYSFMSFAHVLSSDNYLCLCRKFTLMFNIYIFIYIYIYIYMNFLFIYIYI